jgi:hypothetical protein
MLVVGSLAFAGCDSLSSLTAVEGKVTVDGQPISGGRVAFLDAASGTNKGVDITGTIGSDGAYKMTSNGKAGVPKGKYKVTVNTMVPGAAPSGDPAKLTGTAPGGSGILQRSANEKYEMFDKTDLIIEVPSPSYDLKLTK